VLERLKPLTDYLVGKLMQAGEMSLGEALVEIRSFENKSVTPVASVQVS
jgi:cell division protease FtsH